MTKFSITLYTRVLDWCVNYMVCKGYMPCNARLTDHLRKHSIGKEQLDDLAEAAQAKFGLEWSTTNAYGSESLLSFIDRAFQWDT